MSRFGKAIIFTRHAKAVQLHRDIETSWIERTLAEPEWTAPDPNDSTLQRAFRPITERDNRILRVVFSDEADHVRVISAFFDRNAARPQ